MIKKFIMLFAFVAVFLITSSGNINFLLAAPSQGTTSKKKLTKKKKLKKTYVKKKKSKIKSKIEKTKQEQEIITTMGGKTRIDFADLLIEGQTKKADTVYLFERTESNIDSLVKIRKDFRKEIMNSYLE